MSAKKYEINDGISKFFGWLLDKIMELVKFSFQMWLTLAEQHVRRRGIIWKEAERTCFNEWASPDDEGLGDQIIKVLKYFN